jgi:hypothetical protein
VVEDSSTKDVYQQYKLLHISMFEKPTLANLNLSGQSREDSPEQHLKTQKRPGTKVVKPQQPSSAFVMAATSCVTPAGQSSGASTVNGRSEEELLLMDPKKVKRILANREVGVRSYVFFISK